MSEFFSAGQTFSSLHGNTVSAVDIVVTVRRNAYNEARLSASMNKPRFPSSPNGMLLDRPATTGRIMRQLGPSSPGGLTGQRPLTRPLSHSSLLARNPPPMSEIAEEEEEAMSIHLGRKRSVSASSIGSVPRRSLDLEFSVPSGGRKSRDTSEVTAATAASASLKKRSKSAESHKSCPEVFERPQQLPSRHPYPRFVPLQPVCRFARSASRGSTTDTAATTVAEIPTSGSVSGDEIEKDIPARPDSSTSTASAGAVTLARQSTPVPVKEGDEVIPMERGVSKSGSFMTTKRGKGDSTKGSDSGGEIQTLSHKRTSTLLGGGRSAKAVSKSFLAANEEVPGDEDTQKRNRRRRICVIVGVAVAFLLAGLGITLFFVWPRVPVVMVTSATGRSTDFEPVAGTSGKVGGATFIAQFKNQVVLEVASASFVGMNVRSVTFSGVMSRRNGTRNPEGTFTGTFDGSSLPARRSVNVTVPTLFTYSTFSRVNITGDQVATYPQILNAVCTLVDPGSSRLVLVS
ncbi:hypothetical protein BC829DRAFT_397436 [Chytridium lagenaria]|nr:hypothetical protein BC829DRAFT_397436 [Chytridium lagenaria]